MVSRMLVPAVIAVLVAGNSPTLAQNRLIKKIVQEWKKRKNEIQSLTCSTTVDSFYPKGCLSEKNRPGQSKSIYPRNDTRFNNEACSWAIDFQARRIRIESSITVPFGHGDGRWSLAPDSSLKLFFDGKFRVFRPKAADPRGAGATDGVLYERVSHDFVVSLSELPLLWLTGGVSGQWPSPHRMQYLADADEFQYRGAGEIDGRKCVIITVLEQQSGTTVREFWVGSESPYSIYQCRASHGKVIYWQLTVKYRKDNGRIVPAKWTLIDYNVPGTLFDRRTYSVKEIKINPTLSASLFQKPLEPGMVIHHAERNQNLEVDMFGNLVPPGTAAHVPSWLLWAVAGTVLLLVSVFAHRLYSRRWKSAPTE